MFGYCRKARICVLMTFARMPTPWTGWSARARSGRLTPAGYRLSASLIHWDGCRHPMRLRKESGIWELFVPGALNGQLYKLSLSMPMAICG